MFICTCIIGKVDLMLFSKHAVDMLFRIEVIDQPGAFHVLPMLLKTVSVCIALLLHLDKVPPEDRLLTCAGLYIFADLQSQFNLKTCREKYHGINFPNNF